MEGIRRRNLFRVAQAGGVDGYLGIPLLLATRNLARVLQEESRFPVFESDTAEILQRKSNRDSCSSVERLSFGSVSLVVSSAELPRLWFCPSDLGECSLVRCCSFRTFIGFLGMDCNVWDQKNFLATFLFQKIVISSKQSVLPIFKL